MKTKLRKFIFIFINILIVSPFVVQADIYVLTTQQGVTYFSDTPQPGAKSLPIADAQSYLAPVLPAINKSVVKWDIKPTYKNLSIVKPVDQETVVGDKKGSLVVKVLVQPALRSGDKFRLFIDGKALLTHKKAIFELKNIDRGAHVLQTQIVDLQDKVLINSSSITFYMQRTKKSQHS